MVSTANIGIMLPLQRRQEWIDTSLCRRRRRSRSVAAGLMFCCCSLALVIPPSINAYSVLFMSSSTSPDKYTYQPPVKTSVEQLQRSRRRFGSGGSYTQGGADFPRSTAQAAISGTLSMPTNTGVRSFEDRMRDLVAGGLASKEKASTRLDHLRPRNNFLPTNVLCIDSLQDYRRVVGDEREMIVAVRFYANYCKACQAVAPHFYKLAKYFPNTLFVDVPVTERNTALHQGLGIPTLPFAHIYHPEGGLVEELKLTRNHVASFKDILASYVDGSCPLWPDDESALSPLSKETPQTARY